MTPQKQADEIARLIGARLGIRGATLDTRIRKAGRLLPRRIRRDAELLVRAADFAEHPKLARLIDPTEQRRAHRDCKKYLEQIDGTERLVRMVLALLSANAFNLLAVTALVIAVLVWRGFL